MKTITLLLLLTGCAQTYQTYHTIDKHNFTKDGANSPITPKMVKTKKVERGHCEGQFFFFSNAKKKTDSYLPRMIGSLCGDSKYLMDSRLTETWWTTIIYSRSCVKFEAHCPRVLSR